MAPDASLPKRKPRENQYLFDLGVRGRKTGLTLPDTGERDENGLEPMDHLFSSPEKPQANGRRRNANATISSDESMVMGESTIPEPADVLEERQRSSMRLPPPRSKSPVKTYLQSPARRHPSFGPASSPVRGDIVGHRAAPVSASVNRKLDFSKGSFDGSGDAAPVTGPKKRPTSTLPSSSKKLTNGHRLAPLQPATSSDDRPEDDERDVGDYEPADEFEHDSIQMINGGEDDDVEGSADENIEMSEPEPEPEPPKKNKGKAKDSSNEASAPAEKRGRPKKTAAAIEEGTETEVPKKGKGRPKKVVEEIVEEEEEEEEQETGSPELIDESNAPEPLNKKGGRPKKRADPEGEVEGPARPSKRPRRSLDNNEEAQAVAKPKQTAAAKKAAAQAKSRPRMAPISEDSPQVQRGPPMPRSNRGLFILRRETPVDGLGFQKTRSGRNSVKPLAFWKNERIEYSDDEEEEHLGRDLKQTSRFMLSRIKEVVRADEVEQPKRSNATGGRLKSSKTKKKRVEPEPEDEDDLEEWEVDPGKVVGEVQTWDPEDPLGTQAEVQEEEIAFSSAAIITNDVKAATFRFAKTLSLPFFGSGMLDFPPGSIKKPKNSRKMQMTFFVFYGRVNVTINDNTFRIGKGGMFHVYRGNFYSIENDYGMPARIFFSQGCEIEDGALAAESQ